MKRKTESYLWRKDSPPVKSGLRPIRFSTIFLLGLLPLAAPLPAQKTATLPPFTFRHFSGQDGLPDNKVSWMLSHPDGFYWAVARREVSRFDGYRFVPFAVKLPDVEATAVSHSGKIVLLHDGNRQFYSSVDTETGRVSTVSFDSPKVMRGLVKATFFQDSVLWTMNQDADGLHFFRHGEGQKPRMMGSLEGEFFEMPEKTRQPRVLSFAVESGSDAVWLAFENGEIGRFIPNSGKLARFPTFWEGQNQRAMPHAPGIFLQNGRTPLVFSPRFAGLLKFNAEKKGFELLARFPGGNSCFVAGADVFGNLLVTPNREERKVAWLFRNADHAWMNLAGALKNYSFTSGSGADLTRQIWAVTLEGLVQITFHPPLFKKWLPDDLARKNGIFECRAIRTEPTTGKTLILSEQYGFYEATDNHLAHRPFSIGKSGAREFVPEAATNFEFDAEGKIWLARNKPDTNFVRLDLASGRAFFFKNQHGFSIKHFCREPSGKFWLAVRMPNGDGGIFRFDPKTEKFSPEFLAEGFAVLEKNEPWFIKRGKDGRLWLGAAKGIFLIDPMARQFVSFGREEDQRFFRDFPVATIEEGEGDRLFIGTLGGGLRIFNTKTNDLKVLTVNEGLAANKIAGIVPMGLDNGWASTWDGLSYFNVSEKKEPRLDATIINFTVLDGLTHNEFNRFSYWRDVASGRIIFGGLIGANSFIHKELVSDFTPESDKVLLTHFSKFSADGRDKIGFDTLLTGLDAVTVFAQNRTCTFRFALADFWQPEKNRFQYCLQNVASGEAERWQFLGNNHEITFNYLPAGKYSLRVRAANSNGFWSSDERKLTLVVEEHWFKTKWAFALYFLAAGIAAYAFHGFQRRKQKLQLARKEMELVKEQAHAHHLEELNAAFARFVPHDFLRRLGYESVLDTRLGDQIQTRMTILFADIRDWTTLSEKMDPAANFNFINAYLNRVGPVIREHSGFVNAYLGDGLMALFPEHPADALRAAIGIQRAVAEFNVWSVSEGFPAIRVGIGLHTGRLMLGVLGDHERYDTGVISDAVNTAARVEGLTKIFGAAILCSEKTITEAGENDFASRFLGKIQVKGKEQALGVYEVFDGNDHESLLLKQAAAPWFEKGLEHYFARRFDDATRCFREAARLNPTDHVAERYLNRCEKLMRESPDAEWSGVEMMERK